jgi:hypothetical protein
LRGRQIANEIDRVGLRLKLRKAPAEAGDIILLFANESEALTHPYLARAWAKRGADLRVPAPGQSKKIAMMGALDWLSRRLLARETHVLERRGAQAGQSFDSPTESRITPSSVRVASANDPGLTPVASACRRPCSKASASPRRMSAL